jgi:hypothetical protein
MNALMSASVAPTPTGSNRIPNGLRPILDPASEQELEEHLEYRPWIDLGIEFDVAACHAEATALLDQYVAYQSNPTYGIRHWRSLALRAFEGDATRAAMPEGPEANDESRYAMTPIAEKCPKTMALLDQVLELDRCRSVAFLALLPHSRIAPHVDDTYHEVMRSVNVALNMPTGCAFHIDTLPDGSLASYSQQVPFQTGSVMLVNVARSHFVENKSDTVRIHIVARGPTRIPAAQLVSRARAQNGFATQEALREAVRRQYEERGIAGVTFPEPGRYQRRRRISPM